MLEISLKNYTVTKCKLIYFDYRSIPKGDGKSVLLKEKYDYTKKA
jgi:hypothetical protein